MTSRSASVDPPGFGELYEQYATRALRLAGLLCGERSEAEDAVAEAFARTLPKWEAGRVQEFWPYLRVAVVNQVRGRARREVTARRWMLGQRGPTDVEGVDGEVADRADLGVVLRSLPPMQRQAVVLRYVEDLSEAETAAVLGCGVGSVKSNTSRGVAALRRLLNREVPDGG